MISRTTALRTLTAIVSIVLLQSCAVAPPEMTARYEPKISLREIALLLNSQAKKCWTKKVSPIHVGIHIDSKVALDDTVVINAYSVNWSAGLSPKPFATIHIKGNPLSPTVEIFEGELACSTIVGCRKLNLSPHVEKWLSGDLQCFDFSGSIMNL